MDDNFSAPSSVTGIQWDDLKGALLLFKPTEYVTGIKTQFGDANAMRADVTVLDGDLAGTFHDDTLVFPKLLSSQLKPKVGGMVLGRLGQGDKKPGQSPPWKLTEAVEADKVIARAHIAKTTEAPF